MKNACVGVGKVSLAMARDAYGQTAKPHGCGFRRTCTSYVISYIVPRDRCNIATSSL